MFLGKLRNISSNLSTFIDVKLNISGLDYIILLTYGLLFMCSVIPRALMPLEVTMFSIQLSLPYSISFTYDASFGMFSKSSFQALSKS